MTTEPETQEVTITVPKPPKGWVIENRMPKDKELHLYFTVAYGWKYSPGRGSSDASFPLAFPAPKRKRLLTPSELVGKYLRLNDSAYLVHGIVSNTGCVYFLSNCEYVSALKDYTYSLTPTSERLPLEIEDEQ